MTEVAHGRIRLVTPLGESTADEALKAQKVKLVGSDVPIGGAPPVVPAINKSGTIAVANTAQDVAAAKSDRHGFELWNISDFLMWYDITGVDAVLGSPSIPLIAGAFRIWDASAIFNGRVSIICATAGAEFVAKEL